MAEIKKIKKNSITLSKSVTYNGVEYTELDFDFEKLTGADGMSIEAELQAQGIAVLVESVTGPYLARMAIRACKQPIGVDIFDDMALNDYVSIKGMAKSFLLKSN